jgi:hypothetical protein
VRSWIALGALASAALGTHGLLVAAAPWTGRAGAFLLGISLAAAISGITALAAPRLPRGRAAACAIVAVSALLHLLWLLPQPTLSDDLARYAYEGALVRQGVSPYKEPPAARATGSVGHPNLSSCYPPASLALFAVGGVAGERGVRLLFALASVAAGAVLAWLLGRSGAPPARAAAYAWAPLPVIEFAGSGHHDAVGVLFLVVALGLLAVRRPLAAAASWALSVATKGLPVVTAPAFWGHWRWRDRAFALALAAALLWPLALTVSDAHSGLRAYATRWEHNATAYLAVRSATKDADTARLVCAALAGGLCLWIGRRIRTPSRSALACLAVTLFLSPTFHPWYAAWVLALAPIVGSAGAWALGQTVLATYAMPGVQATPGFAPVPISWSAAIWAPAIVLWSWEVASASRRGRVAR